MAYVNVAEWKTDQVCEWLKGLDNSVLPYVHSFTNNAVNGQQLLNLRPEDLEQLGVLKLGHQEIILEAVEYLRNFHYELDRENLQLLALHLSCQAHSLRNELSRHTDSKPVATQTLSDVASVVTAVKPLVRWLDRPPFSGQLEYNDKKSELLKLSLEMATCAQRDRFAEKPIEEIRTTCEQLAKLADYIIQDIADPMILQPASLDLATLKKRPGDDLGFYILPSFHGNHQIAEIKFGSAAHTCGKMEEGDEIVQVNYQTVVGWERKNVLELFTESPAEVLLTLKRRPRHTKVYGQIYIKPYRLPSNKKTPYATRWQHNLPSPRPELLTIPDFTMPLPRYVPKEPSPEPAGIIDTGSMLDTMATDSSDSDSEVEPPLSIRLYATKPRNFVQRRATITGASPTTKHGIDIEQFWKELKQEHSTTFQLRDKAASCAHGLDNVQSNHNRPQTCLGIEQTKRKKRNDERSDDRKVQFNEKTSETVNSQIDDIEKMLNETTTKNFRRDAETFTNSTTSNNDKSDNAVPFEKFDDIDATNATKDREIARSTEIGNFSRGRKERGKLDKSYSTPAYDLTETALTDIVEIREPRNKINNGEINCPSCASSITKNETDCRVSGDILDNKNDDGPKNSEEIDVRDSEIIGNVAQRVNYIESQSINKNVEEKTIVAKFSNEQSRNVVVETNSNDSRRKLVDAKFDDETVVSESTNLMTIEKFDPRNPTTAKLSFEIGELGRDSSEEKSESTSSYIEGTYSSSSDVDVSMKKLLSNEAMIAHGFIERNNDAISFKDSTKNSRRLSDVRENFVEKPLTTESSSNSSSSLNAKYSRQTGSLTRDCGSRKISESATTELSKKLETKLRLTPPEPPPRKYFSKPLPLNISVNSNCSTDFFREQPKLPERPEHRPEFRKNDSSEIPSTIPEVSAVSRNRDGFEGYRDFVEKSMDFIDEPVTPMHDHKSTSFVDHYGYTEIYEGRVKNEKFGIDKHDGFNEKFGNGTTTPTTTATTSDNGPPEIAPRSFDSPDGSGCSRQAQTIETKPKSSEKEKHYEKGVVNRAMMVARSMGLHGSSNKSSSSSSPRSSRKRNLLLAKRRNVSVKDVGPGELEGWLTYRSKGAGGAWARSWFVLKSSSLYRFKAQDSPKSDCLIALPGFTASTASEVKSRKYAFKVYHTGTVFYFAADTDDSLALWLDSINRATFGADRSNRTSGLFSETDESDGETGKNRGKEKGNADSKSGGESMFGSLKKIGRKDSTGYKDHDIGGASLDRKYLRFLGARNQNVPVPTAQFRSYRRVLPTSTPNRKQDSTPNSPDLRVTVAGSTFYGLSSSQSATDVPSTSQDMGDYRQTTDRSQSIRGRRSDDLRGFVTLEEFMLAHQSAERRGTMSDRSSSPRITPLTSDHVHVQHRNFDDNLASNAHTRSSVEPGLSNGMIYGHPRNGEESPSSPIVNNASHENSRHEKIFERPSNLYSNKKKSENSNDCAIVSKNDDSHRRTFSNANEKKSFVPDCSYNRKIHEGAVYYPNKQNDPSQWQNFTNEITHEQNRSLSQQSSSRVVGTDTGVQNRYRGNDGTRIDFSGPRIQPRNNRRCDNSPISDNFRSRESNVVADSVNGLQSISRRFVNDNGYVGSSGDLTCCASSSETLQRARKEASVSRRGSFNLTDRRREHLSPDKHWMDSLRRNDKKNGVADKSRLKNVAQYQPPPIPTSPFEQDGMRAAFEMHLDKAEHVHKTNRLKSLFGSKSPQKPNTLDLPKESPKTLLGSPRLHRALFRDKSSSQQSRQATTIRSGSQSPGDSGISQSMSSYSGNSQSHTLSQSFSSVSSVSDWSPDTPTPNATKCLMGHAACQKRFPNSNRNSLTPPTLPYIPPPTSPPPDDYPGLEYPPVFEPGTYSLTDASLMRSRSKNSQNKGNRESEDVG